MKALSIILVLLAVMAEEQTLHAQCPTQRFVVPVGTVSVTPHGYTGSGTLAQLDVTVNGHVYRVPCLCVSTRTSTTIQVFSNDLVDEQRNPAKLQETQEGYYWSSSGNSGLAEVEYNPY